MAIDAVREKFDHVKKHVAENKWVYISGAGAILLAGTAGFVLGQEGYQKFEILNFKINSPDNSQTTVILNRRGTLSNFVRDLDTNAVYESQNLAAKALGVNPSTVSKHLSGKYPTAAGHHLAIIGESA
jgi:hypothetical protein